MHHLNPCCSAQWKLDKGPQSHPSKVASLQKICVFSSVNPCEPWCWIINWRTSNRMNLFQRTLFKCFSTVKRTAIPITTKHTMSTEEQPAQPINLNSSLRLPSAGFTSTWDPFQLTPKANLNTDQSHWLKKSFRYHFETSLGWQNARRALKGAVYSVFQLKVAASDSKGLLWDQINCNRQYKSSVELNLVVLV